MPEPLKIALIGCGDHSGAQHAPAMHEYARWHGERVELSGVCDLRAERAEDFRRRFGFRRAFTDWRGMLAELRPDGVVCVVPVQHVAALATALLEAEVPCTIEKPLGDSIEEARRLAETAERTHTPHMVSVNRRFNEALCWARDRALARGPIQFIRAAMLRSGRREAQFIWATGIHMVDAVVGLAGPVRRWSRRIVPTPGLPPTTQAVELEFESGCAGQIVFAPNVGAVEESYELAGTDYVARAVVLGPGSPMAEIRYRQGDGLVREEYRPVGEQTAFRREGSYAEFSHFVESLLAGRRPGPEVSQVLPAMELAVQLAAT